MQSFLSRVEALANANEPLLFRGEPGVGKEVLARTLHANSPRRDRPFVVLNCAAGEADALSLELFGAVLRQGAFELAHGGTLFLDEVADLPLAVQGRLLRVVEDREVHPSGGAPVHVDVRLVCSTVHDLQRLVREGRFREDLFYRLNVFTLEVPPLRTRGDDVLALAEMFLEQQGNRAGFTATALGALRGYAWPGNVRELHNAVRSAAQLSRGMAVEPAHLPDAVLQPALTENDPLLSLYEAEKRHVLRVLDACGGQLVDAARVLGIGRTTLWRKLKQYEAVSK